MALLVRLAQAKHRYEKSLAINYLLVAAATGGALMALLALLSHWYMIQAFWFGLVPLPALIWQAIRWQRSRRSLFGIACDLDHRYQLYERLSTACELQQRGLSDGLAAWQITDAEKHLKSIPVDGGYRVHWWRNGRWTLLGGVLLILALLAPVQTMLPPTLTQVQRDSIRRTLQPLLSEGAKRDKYHMLAEKAHAANTVEVAQDALGKLRGKATRDSERQTSTVVESIQTLPIPESAKSDLLKFIEQAGTLSEAQASQRIAELTANLPEEIAAQLRSELKSLDAKRRSLDSLVAGIRQLQHALSGERLVAFNQDGLGSSEQGELGNPDGQLPDLGDPQQTLTLEDTSGSEAASILTQGTGTSDMTPVDLQPNDGIVAAQQGVNIAIPRERIPKRYQKPIETYLQRITQIP